MTNSDVDCVGINLEKKIGLAVVSSAMADAVDESNRYGLSPSSKDMPTGVSLCPPDQDGADGIHEPIVPPC
jgi:hypothetical protein